MNTYGVETCAACSMCKGLCPLSIDTAQIALSMRRIDPPAPELAKKIYDNFLQHFKWLVPA